MYCNSSWLSLQLAQVRQSPCHKTICPWEPPCLDHRPSLLKWHSISIAGHLNTLSISMCILHNSQPTMSHVSGTPMTPPKKLRLFTIAMPSPVHLCILLTVCILLPCLFTNNEPSDPAWPIPKSRLGLCNRQKLQLLKNVWVWQGKRSGPILTLLPECKAKEVDPIHTSACTHMRLQSCSEESNFIHVHTCDYPTNALLMSIACSYLSCGQSHVSAYICLQDVACHSHVRWLQGLFCGLFECLSLLPMHIQAQELPEQRRHQ